MNDDPKPQDGDDSGITESAPAAPLQTPEEPPALIEPIPVAPVSGEPAPYTLTDGEYSMVDDDDGLDTPATTRAFDTVDAAPTEEPVSREYVDRGEYVASVDEVAPAPTDPEVPVAVVEPEAPIEPEYVEPQPVAAAAPAQQVVYVSTPIPPKKKGNRSFGILMAFLASIVFAGLFAVVVVVAFVATRNAVTVSFLTEPSFMVPVVAFFVGFALLVLVTNRANWWAYLLGSLLVGAFVYFGTIGTLLLFNGVVGFTPGQALDQFGTALTNPFVIAAALIARELSMWTGMIIASRGRKVRARNTEARAEFDRGVERDRAGHTAGSPA